MLLTIKDNNQFEQTMFFGQENLWLISAIRFRTLYFIPMGKRKRSELKEKWVRRWIFFHNIFIYYTSDWNASYYLIIDWHVGNGFWESSRWLERPRSLSQNGDRAVTAARSVHILLSARLSLWVILQKDKNCLLTRSFAITVLKLM